MLVLSLLLIGLAITLEPIPLTAFIFVLASKNGTRKGAAFIVGWLASLAAVIAVTVLVTGNNPRKSNTVPSLAALAVKMAIGAALVVIAERKWRKLDKPKPPKKIPKWQTGIDKMSVWFAMALAPITQPWGLVAAGVATIVSAELASWQDYLVLILFCLIATSSYLVLELYAAFRPDKSHAILSGILTWIDTHTDQVIIIVSLTLGVWLIANSILVIVG
jgi:hypothetical protein